MEKFTEFCWQLLAVTLLWGHILGYVTIRGLVWNLAYFAIVTVLTFCIIFRFVRAIVQALDI